MFKSTFAVAVTVLALSVAGCTAETTTPAPVQQPLPAPPMLPVPPPQAPPVPIPAAPEETTTSDRDSDHCGDIEWWSAQTSGDPSRYVAACGEWPYWIPQDSTQQPTTKDTRPPCDETRLSDGTMPYADQLACGYVSGEAYESGESQTTTPDTEDTRPPCDETRLSDGTMDYQTMDRCGYLDGSAWN